MLCCVLLMQVYPFKGLLIVINPSVVILALIQSVVLKDQRSNKTGCFRLVISIKHISNCGFEKTHNGQKFAFETLFFFFCSEKLPRNRF